jgi:hypothetical protein
MTDDELTLIPRSLRDKLDRVGVKLHLKEWAMLSLEERRQLVDAPCVSDEETVRYATALEALVHARCGKAPDRLAPRGDA